MARFAIYILGLAGQPAWPQMALATRDLAGNTGGAKNRRATAMADRNWGRESEKSPAPICLSNVRSLT